MVLSWERSDLNPNMMVPKFQDTSDFCKRYSNRYVQVASGSTIRQVEVGRHWLSDPRRRQYEAEGFEPGGPKVLLGNRLNLWRGLAVTPWKGNWELLFQHIFEVLAAGDVEAGNYIIWWLAWTLQNPGRAAEAVLVFQGEEGAGKGTLARVMLRTFGPYGLPISDPKHLVEAFSGHLQHCVFMFLDEAFWAGNVAAEGRLKDLVTNETITIEPKYYAPFQARNVLHIMMCSNNDWVVPAGHGARRYAVFKVSNKRVGDFAYFDALHAELKAGGVESMVFDLLGLDLGDWHPKEIYKTAALMEQKQQSLRGLDAWIEDLLQSGALSVPLSSTYPNRCLSENLLGAAKKYDPYTNKTRVARKLQEVLGVEEFNVKVLRGWAFPELAECRRLWEQRNGGRWHWHHDVQEWQGPMGTS
jgi:hypothetical protein